jgi:hypothetical protein
MAVKALDIPLPRYRPSGSTRLTIVPYSLAALVLAAIGGVIYTFISSFIPFVMLTIFLVFGLGFAVGVIARFTCQFAHCRNRMLGLALGIACGITALASSYWFHYTLDKRALISTLPASDRPVAEKGFTFNDWVQFRKQAGWRVKGAQMNGGVVTAVWFFEALFVLAFACMLGWQGAAEPYCEQCRAWPTSHLFKIAGHDAEEFLAAARNGSPLAPLQFPKSDRADVSLVFENHICKTCGSGFLDVKEESITTKDGKQQTTLKPIVAAILLDKTSCDKFLAARTQPACSATQSRSPAALSVS